MADELPPFSGEYPTCPKCSNKGARTEYKSPAEPSSGRMLGPGIERLERRCSRCDFTWDEALNPPKEK
ncbi:hypothetical protein [Streptomyces fumanus]|uniref:hypothetical protein n=1 Tax=Streptomyces fumanus TaxID=67302 RepID=UPI0033EC6F8D